jgi:hypothetical protein
MNLRTCQGIKKAACESNILSWKETGMLTTGSVFNQYRFSRRHSAEAEFPPSLHSAPCHGRVGGNAFTTIDATEYNPCISCTSSLKNLDQKLKLIPRFVLRKKKFGAGRKALVGVASFGGHRFPPAAGGAAEVGIPIPDRKIHADGRRR